MSEIATLPHGMADLTGKQVNSLHVTGYAGRNKWNTVCKLCASETVKPHVSLVSESAKCRFDACSLNRLEPTKISKHEAWLNSTEPEKKPEPASVPVVKPPQTSQPSAEYSRYVTHAIRYWNPAEIVSLDQWQTIGERGHNWLLSKVEEDLKHARA